MEQRELADLYAGLRESKVLTQAQLGKIIGADYRTISQYENGERPLSNKNLIKYANYFGVSCDYLLGRTRTAAPDDFIQEVVSRYGLSESVLNRLEKWNKDDDDYLLLGELSISDIVNRFIVHQIILIEDFINSFTG